MPWMMLFPLTMIDTNYTKPSNFPDLLIFLFLEQVKLDC